MKTITINVDQIHIEVGRPGNACLCPVAMALIAKGYRRVHVGRDYLRIGRNPVMELPKEAVNFISWFDRGFLVQPFSFDLEVPD